MFPDICKKLNLGKIIEYSKMTGGVTNQMYKVRTDKGAYALKIINEDILNNKESFDKIENSEIIACIALENNVNAVCAIKFNNKYIQKINDYNIIVYDFQKGIIKLTKDISLENVISVAHQQAQLHQIDVNKYNLDFKNKKYEFNDYQKYYNLLKNRNDDRLIFFKNNYEILVKIYREIYNNYLELGNKLSFVHSDLNRKNIIWNNETPYIIDWETAKVGNPCIDFFNSAWFLSNDVEEDKYYEYAKEYLSIMDIDVQNGVYAGIIEECNWLYFSLSRLFSNNEDEVQLGIDSIESSLKEILHYYNKIPLMLEIIEKVHKNTNNRNR